MAAAQVELQVIEAKVAEKQRALDEVHWRTNIAPGERDENQTLVQRQELASALAQAAEQEASAVSRIHALEQAISLHESRLTRVHVTLEPQAELDRTLRFRVDALLNLGDDDAKVQFDAVLQLSTHTYAVR